MLPFIVLLRLFRGNDDDHGHGNVHLRNLRYWPSFLFEAIIIVLIMLNIIVVVLDTVWTNATGDDDISTNSTPPPGWSSFMRHFEHLSAIVFSLECVWLSCGRAFAQRDI